MQNALPLVVESASRSLVLLVEDEVLVRATLANILEMNGFRVVPVASADEALELLAAVPDINAVVTDVNLASSSLDGFALAQKIWNERKVGVVVISGRASPRQAGFPPEIHFIAKPVHGLTLVHLVRDVIEIADRFKQTRNPDGYKGETSERLSSESILTPRQRDVLELLVRGKSNAEIAQALGLSENTIKVHLAAIFRTLGVSSRVEAVLAGMRLLASKG